MIHPNNSQHDFIKERKKERKKLFTSASWSFALIFYSSSVCRAFMAPITIARAGENIATRLALKFVAYLVRNTIYHTRYAAAWRLSGRACTLIQRHRIVQISCVTHKGDNLKTFTSGAYYSSIVSRTVMASLTVTCAHVLYAAFLIKES